MKKRRSVFLFIFFVLVFFIEINAEKKELPERFKKWLDEEVTYIILPIEKEVFMQLVSDRERDLFIDAFWKQRDPTPGSPENEERTEHYRRINYANHFLGRSVPKAGWKTERGRIYIILGEPNDIQRFEGKSQTYPTEIWFYQGLTKEGLPPGFNMVFFQPGGSGEYKIYSPLRDGPQALMTSFYGDPMDYMAAYEHLRDLEPDLAQVSLSLIPGEGSLAMGRPSMSSDVMIQRIEGTALRKVKDKYARKFLEYKDSVEVEYSVNYIGSDSLVKVIKDPSDIYFVHYAVEPDRLSVNQFEKKYYTTLVLNGTVSNLEGKTVHQFEKKFSLEFDEQQMKDIRHSPLSIRDMFPLIPGNYKISVLMKNEISKEFTSMERNLIIPNNAESLQMTSLILGYNDNINVPSQNRLRPFQMGKHQIYFHAKNVFLRTDNLITAFQIHGLNQDMIERGEIKYTFLKNDEQFRTINKKVSEFLDPPNFVEKFSLQDFFPAHYRVHVSLVLDGREVLTDKDEFDLTHLEAIARPWIYSKLLASSDDPAYSFVLGSQLFNSGKIEEARTLIEKAYRRKPDSVEFGLNLARTLLTLKEYGEIESILLPFLNLPQPPSYELHFILGMAYLNTGEYAKAVDIFNKTINQYGLNINLLNAVGNCYFQLGEISEALAAWEKSLEINSEQPQVRKNVEKIKEKKL